MEHERLMCSHICNIEILYMDIYETYISFRNGTWKYMEHDMTHEYVLDMEPRRFLRIVRASCPSLEQTMDSVPS